MIDYRKQFPTTQMGDLILITATNNAIIPAGLSPEDNQFVLNNYYTGLYGKLLNTNLYPLTIPLTAGIFPSVECPDTVVLNKTIVKHRYDLGLVDLIRKLFDNKYIRAGSRVVIGDPRAYPIGIIPVGQVDEILSWPEQLRYFPSLTLYGVYSHQLNYVSFYLYTNLYEMFEFTHSLSYAERGPSMIVYKYVFDRTLYKGFFANEYRLTSDDYTRGLLYHWEGELQFSGHVSIGPSIIEYKNSTPETERIGAYLGLADTYGCQS